VIAVTIREAKARLNALIEQARNGEEVVLLRGARHVACLVPIDAEDLTLRTRLSDAQAERLWKGLAQDRAAGCLATFASPEAAVRHLREKGAGRSPDPRVHRDSRRRDPS